MQKGNNFDYYYKKALNDDKFQEIFMEGLLSGLGNAVTGAVKGAANVADSVGKVVKGAANVAGSFKDGYQKGIKGQFIEPDKEKPDKIGFKNRPKPKDIIVSGEGGIRAKVVSDIGSDGQWDIELFTNPDPKKQLSYFETTNPKYINGVITTRDHLLLTHYDQGQQAPPQPPPQPPQQQLTEPPDKAKGISKKGNEFIYNSNKKRWVNSKTNNFMISTNEPSFTRKWLNDYNQKQNQQQTQTQKQKKKDYTITSGSGSDYPLLTARVGFNTIYPTWYKEEDQLKNF